MRPEQVATREKKTALSCSLGLAVLPPSAQKMKNF